MCDVDTDDEGQKDPKKAKVGGDIAGQPRDSMGADIFHEVPVHLQPPPPLDFASAEASIELQSSALSTSVPWVSCVRTALLGGPPIGWSPERQEQAYDFALDLLRTPNEKAAPIILKRLMEQGEGFVVVSRESGKQSLLKAAVDSPYRSVSAHAPHQDPSRTCCAPTLTSD